jgi:hypothetical protein
MVTEHEDADALLDQLTRGVINSTHYQKTFRILELYKSPYHQRHTKNTTY